MRTLAGSGPLGKRWHTGVVTFTEGVAATPVGR
ncbi:hypothetical protein ABIC52_002624 [Curtobacterium oceanosedimentum]